MSPAEPQPPAPRVGCVAAVFGAIVKAALDILFALIHGIFRSPVTAVEKAITPIDVRRARPSEVVPLRHAVLRRGRPRETAVFPGDELPDAVHVVADRGGEIVGVATVHPSVLPGADEPRWQLRGMAVSEGLRGSGIGRAMLELLEREVDAPMWCNARQTAVGFYERHGWRVVSDPFEIEGVGPHRRMRWDPGT